MEGMLLKHSTFVHSFVFVFQLYSLFCKGDIFLVLQPILKSLLNWVCDYEPRLKIATIKGEHKRFWQKFCTTAKLVAQISTALQVN
jgi:hypothetical protein